MKLYVCTGKHCRKQSESADALTKALGERVERVDVKCQKICRGPVVGMKLDGQIEWFQRVDSPKSMKAVLALTEGEAPKKSLRKRHVPKRTGELRK